ncbi:MAG: putative toxin-antitoxin system toxin component, PIN family [Dehalococcoidia bacterium]|nr:putative toxin-antitoxin system toxin component, PIN family [Dehalococcoidia bacterium]MDZ4246478.1 putative toxin-antitoxin system toxin component, PIN family [Dehalococcoidia bacterium]
MSKHKLRVFLDTNVIFSGLYSPEGAPGIILGHFVKASISVIVSQQVLEEVVRTVKEKLPEALPALRKLLVNTPPEVVTDPKLQYIERWAMKLNPGDAAILSAALSAQPDYFITGNRHFIDNQDIAEEAELRIVTPAQFLEARRKEGDIELLNGENRSL